MYNPRNISSATARRIYSIDRPRANRLRLGSINILTSHSALLELEAKSSIHCQTMDSAIDPAKIASLLSEPSRSRILATLLDGRAKTGKELAFAARITAQTVSSHLSKLLQAALVTVEAQGRHRYYRIGREDVATAVESILAVTGHPLSTGDNKFNGLEPIKLARFCYDHLAGRLGVELLAALKREKFLAQEEKAFTCTASGQVFFDGLGIPVRKLQEQRRRFACTCLDWSERIPHLGGALGCALASRMLMEKWIHRARESRVVTITPAGTSALKRHFGIQLPAMR